MKGKEKEKTVKEKKAEKKPKYIPKRGKFGNATDYNIYEMNRQEKLTGALAGFGIGFAAMYIVYNNILVGLVLGVLVGIAGVPFYQNYLNKKRHKRLLTEFRDLLEALTASLRVGRSVQNAFKDARADLSGQYGDEAEIVKEVDTIILGIDNAYTAFDMMNDFADRSGIEDVRNFAMILPVCEKTGGDSSRVIAQTHDVISQKMSTELEIQTIITETKSQMNIMMIMPFVIILLMRFMKVGGEANASIATIAVKTVAMGIFALAYWIGQKIADIKV